MHYTGMRSKFRFQDFLISKALLDRRRLGLCCFAAFQRCAEVARKCPSIQNKLQLEKTLDYLFHIKYLHLKLYDRQRPHLRGLTVELLADLETEEVHEMIRLLSKLLRTMELSAAGRSPIALRNA